MESITPTIVGISAWLRARSKCQAWPVLRSPKNIRSEEALRQSQAVGALEELPDVGDTVNLDFVRNVVGKSRVAAGAIVCRTPNSFPLPSGFRALPVIELR
jgi:hypothetical protein